jgi:class 3 adenylate cyclase
MTKTKQIAPPRGSPFRASIATEILPGRSRRPQRGRGRLGLIERGRRCTTLQTRVGIATGVVVVGDLIGTGSAQEQAIAGETPNLAAQLQGFAAPDIVIAESTRRLLGNLFELEDLEAKELKGIEGAVLMRRYVLPHISERVLRPRDARRRGYL